MININDEIKDFLKGFSLKDIADIKMKYNLKKKNSGRPNKWKTEEERKKSIRESQKRYKKRKNMI